MHQVVIGVVEFVERGNEFVTAPGLDFEDVEVKDVSFFGERKQWHVDLLFLR